jgi:putative oxidoreductase
MGNTILGLFRPAGHGVLGSVALVILRLVAGSAFVQHGFGKIQSPLGWMGPDSAIPAFFQLLAALSEFGGGIAWVLGLLTPLASFGIACTMTVAVYFHMVVRGDPFVNMTQELVPTYELPAAYLCIALVLLTVGPGKFSLDRKLFGERS